ncbi:MAG: hypothetical protein ACE5E1_06525 [Phycisphaerae bacterium]
MRHIKRLLLVVFAAAVMGPVLGCGVGTTVADNRRTFNRVVDYDARMLVDDVSLFMQTNRTLRTSRWVID